MVDPVDTITRLARERDVALARSQEDRISLGTTEAKLKETYRELEMFRQQRDAAVAALVELARSVLPMRSVREWFIKNPEVMGWYEPEDPGGSAWPYALEAAHYMQESLDLADAALEKYEEAE